jgi:phosphoglycerate dehydrogenase-like enzyme
MIGAAQIAKLKPEAIIINVGRGPVINEAALIDALRNKRIRGAALDVFDVEPLPADSPFYQLDNVYLSPHCADHVPQWQEDAMHFFVTNFHRFAIAKPLENIVDKQAGY